MTKGRLTSLPVSSSALAGNRLGERAQHHVDLGRLADLVPHGLRRIEHEDGGRPIGFWSGRRGILGRGGPRAKEDSGQKQELQHREEFPPHGVSHPIQSTARPLYKLPRASGGHNASKFGRE